MFLRILRTKIVAILVGLALITALSALVMSLSPFNSDPSVLVLRRDLARGDPLDRSAVMTVRVPAPARPRDALDVNAALPAHWPGEPVKTGTILSESVISGSALGRSLSPGQALVSVSLDPTQVPPLEAGDYVDVWGFPDNCDTQACAATLVSARAKISSVTVGEGATWTSSQAVKIDLIVNAHHTNTVLGHAGTATLSLALSPSPSP